MLLFLVPVPFRTSVFGTKNNKNNKPLDWLIGCIGQGSVGGLLGIIGCIGRGFLQTCSGLSAASAGGFLQAFSGSSAASARGLLEASSGLSAASAGGLLQAFSGLSAASARGLLQGSRMITPLRFEQFQKCVFLGCCIHPTTTDYPPLIHPSMQDTPLR